MVVLEGGRVLDHGSTESVLARPASRFVADLAGLNRLAGVAVESGSAVEDDHAVHLADGVEVTGVPDEVAGPVVGQEALALFEPAAVSVHLSAPGGRPRNTFGAEVTGLEPRGALVRVHAVLAGGQRASADVTPRSIGALGLTVGTAVVLAVKAAQVRIVRH
ncbi:TOBE domain-containing protein [Aestuariimicrobium ganziense]|uniref:TOBE domain-containing protein n=1 Tax=Aestuariimicrobium ganziense TaxID=2773677 RepID=UPI001F260467